jgi:hypothetical protein
LAKASYTWLVNKTRNVQVSVYYWKNAVSGDWSTAKDWTPTGGPKLIPGFGWDYYKLVSEDSAVFATGSNQAYTVTGTGHATAITVSHDSVTFKNFTFSNDDGTGSVPNITVENNANATFSATSNLNLFTLQSGEGYGECGSLVVTNAQLTIHGLIEAEPYINAGGVVTVSGAAAQLQIFPGVHEGGQFGAVAKGGVVNIVNGGEVTGAFASVDGTINVSGSQSRLSGATINADGSVNGSNGGSIQGNTTPSPYQPAGQVVNNGNITATNGLFKIDADVQGTGTLAIDNGATLELGYNTSNNVTFLNHANLLIDKGVIQTGFMQHFSTNDTIDFVGQEDVSSLSVAFANGKTLLTLYDGASISDQLTFASDLTAGNFYAKQDSSGGGTLVAFESHLIPSPIPIT